MNKRERFQRFLRNEPVDRVPVGFWRHYCTNDEKGTVGLDNDAVFEKNIEGHRQSKKVFNPDMVKIMSDSLMFMPIDTSFVKSASDLKYVEPVSMDSKYVRRLIELTKRVRDIYDEDTPVYATAFSPLYHLRVGLIGGFANMVKFAPDTLLLKLFHEDPEAFSRAVAAVGESVTEINRLMFTECGVDGIYFSVNNRNKFLPEDPYRQYIAPLEKKVLEDANAISDTNLLHVCGQLGLANNLEMFRDYDAAAINWAVYAENVSLLEGKKMYGGKAVIGGFNNAAGTVLHTGTRAEVEARTREILDEVGQIGVMIGADCAVPADINEERFEWVRQCAEEYAQSK